MVTKTKNIFIENARPIAIGVFAVIAVISAGMTAAFVTGIATPHLAKAGIILPPCCTVPPPLPPVIPPIMPPVVVIPPVVIPPVVPPPEVPVAECVFLRASTNTITAPGQPVTLSWKTNNATSITIDNGVGVVTPTAEGSIVVNPTGTTQYRATVTGANGSANCADTVKLEPPVQNPAQCVFLTATPTSIKKGESVTLRWKTINATSLTISPVVGTVGNPAEGSAVVTPLVDTTYVATVTGATGSVNCQVTVRITDAPPGPQCISLTASRETIKKGESVTLTWQTKDAASVNITNVGNVTPVAGGSVVVSPTSETTYTATVPNASLNPFCTVTVRIESDVCTSNCGGGGGGGGGGSSRSKPKVLLDSLEQPGEQPLAFVYLSDVPYTGLELGPVGTVVYWTLLIGWSAAAAYLVLFMGLPMLARRAQSFGSNVRDALNSDSGAGHGHDTHAAHSSHGAHDAHASVPHDPYQPPAPSGYSPEQGFRSFASQESLSIDDIVKGLSRMSDTEHVEHAVVPVGPAHDTAPISEPVHHVAPQAAPMNVEGPASIPAHLPADVPGFIKALLSGDREGTFGTIREVTRAGGNSEEFLTHAVCALDDAYRARIDGTAVHPEVARITENCATPFLERVVTSLTTAVDGSYSAGVTGVKLAVTRALAVVNG